MKRILVLLSEANERTVLRMSGVSDFFLGDAKFQLDYRTADQVMLGGGNAFDGTICIGGPVPGFPADRLTVGVGDGFRRTEATACWIREDSRAVGVMAAEQLANQWVSEAFMISAGPDSGDTMWKGFSDTLSQRKLPCSRIDLSGMESGMRDLVRKRLAGKRSGILLASTLLALPLREVLFESNGAIWVTGGDAPEVAADLGLTSSVEASRRMGWLAAACLVKAMTGAFVPATLEVPPLAIEKRRSTYPFVGTGCEEVESALAFIRNSLDRDIGVDDVARAAGVSRSVLQRRIKQTFNLSVLSVIQWHRVERVKTCLPNRNLGMEQISEMTGFSSSGHMNEVFKKWTGTTPKEFRSQFKTQI